MPYRAQGGGAYGSSVYPDSRPRIDVGQILDAAGNATQSVIHSVLLRRQAENAIAMQKNQQAMEQQRIGIERDRETREAARQDADLALRRESERHRFLENGGIPAHEDVQPVGGTATVQASPTPISPIRRAMGAGDASAIPGVQVTPSDASGSIAPVAQPSTTDVYHNETVQVPESFNPTRAAAFQRGVAIQELRNEGLATKEEHRQQFQAEQQEKRLAAQQKGREFAATAAQQLARLKATLSNKGNGAIPKAMTGNAREAAMQSTAAGLLEQFDGSLDQATEFLENDAAGQKLAKEGLEVRHLIAARGKYVTTATNQAVRLQTGANGLPADKAVDAVAGTRKKVALKTGKVGGADTPPANATKPSITKAEKDALVKQGFKEKDVLDRYTVTPEN